MKNIRRTAQIIAGVLAIMMILGVVMYVMPVSYAAEDTTKTEEKKKEEQEKHIKDLEAERERLVKEYTSQILDLISTYKGKPGYYAAVEELENFLDSINPRETIDPSDLEHLINNFRKDESETFSHPILMGDDKGNFNPNNKLTRAEFAVILSRLDNQNLIGGSNWYESAMNYAKSKGYLKGDDSGNMMPNKQISLAEVITVFVRYKGFTKMEGNMSKIPEGHWAMGEMQRAYMDRWIEDIDNISNCDRAITRGELASILTRVRQIEIDREKINKTIGLYKTFLDVQSNNRYYYDILVNTK